MILNPLPPEKSNPDSELKSVLGMSSPGKCDNLVPHKKLPPKRWGDESDSDSDWLMVADSRTKIKELEERISKIVIRCIQRSVVFAYWHKNQSYPTTTKHSDPC
jgi:hypothetical protein